ncbi:MAG: hypothetical protein R3B90_04860 [Planctomycetaceae bacterium]
MLRLLPLLCLVCLLVGPRHVAAAADEQSAKPAYDPLQVAQDSEVETHDLVVRDATRSRDLPVFVYLPNAPQPAAVVLFSHGLGGTRKMSAYLGKALGRAAGTWPSSCNTRAAMTLCGAMRRRSNGWPR